MATKNSDERVVSVVRTGSTQALHLIAGNIRGMVAFVCEYSVMTFQNYGLPTSCPVCGTRNPLKGEKDEKCTT